MYGSGEQYLRIQTTQTIGSEAAIELVRGGAAGGTIDWKLSNTIFGLRLSTSDDNFTSTNTSRLLFSNNGRLGIGIQTPQAKVHVAFGSNATNTNDGYLLIGNKSGGNLVMDTDGILARFNGSPNSLHFQTLGSGTHIGGIGTTHTLIPAGQLVVGGAPANARMNVRSDGFQINLRNAVAGGSNWSIGASNEGWITGNDQLVFSPSGNSDDAALRLMDIGDNDGINAPVMIRNHPDQKLLIDGNEIDGATGSLYFNHNSDEETYINPTGGDVGIGTTNPEARLHITTNGFAVALERDGLTWWLSPMSNGDVGFSNNNGPLALVSNVSGAWIPLSDSTRKHQVEPLTGAMDRINRIQLKSYQFKNAPADRRDIGVIAQDLEPIVPEAVHYDAGQYGVSYDGLTALAVRGIQEQQAEIEALRDALRKLKSLSGAPDIK